MPLRLQLVNILPKILFKIRVKMTGNHLPIAHDHVHDSLLDEVHLWPNCPLFDDDISCTWRVILLYLFNLRIFYRVDSLSCRAGHLVEKLHTEALSQLRKQKRDRHSWRKAPKQPKPYSCSLSRPHEASRKALQESVLRRRICPDICAQSTCERHIY